MAAIKYPKSLSLGAPDVKAFPETQYNKVKEIIDRINGITTVTGQVIPSSTGTVTQLTSITTGVTLNTASGIITTVSATTAHDAASTFTVTNSFATATSNIRAYIVDYAGTFATNGLPSVAVDNRTAGTFDIVIMNNAAANALSGVLKIGFEIIS